MEVESYLLIAISLVLINISLKIRYHWIQNAFFYINWQFGGVYGDF